MTDEAAIAQAPPAPEAAAATAPAADPIPAAVPESVDALPGYAQKMIHDLRAEAAANRTRATGAEQAKQETMDAIAKALGLKGDDDPAKAAKTAAEERDAARKAAQDATTTLSVYRMAAKQGANPEALTDSRAFMAQIDALDPAATDFVAQMEEVVKKTIEANPLLKSIAATPAPPARSGGPVSGGAAIPGQLTKDDLVGMSSEAIVKAKKDGLLNNLLDITQ